MLRRARPAPAAPGGTHDAAQPDPAALVAPGGGVVGAGQDRHPGGLVAELDAAGWALPRGLRTGGEPHWTLVGTVDSPTATAVDPTGLVAGEGWCLDWWIGADDRWHVPTREAAVRQQSIDGAPVVETLLKVPGGDAVARAYGIRAPRSDGGDEWVIAEIENATSIPFAVAVVVRPFLPDAIGAVRQITLEPVAGGRGRDVPHLVRVDGVPAAILPRRPARVAAGNRADGDALEIVTAGRAGTDLIEASCPDALATLAFVFPLPHTAILRVAIPVGAAGPVGEGAPSSVALDYPSAIPPGATVASGWEVHRRGPRIELPDRRLMEALDRARAQVLLAHDGQVVRRDGRVAPDLEPGATEVILGAFDLLDRPSDVGAVAARWPDRLAAADAATSAIVLSVVARHWLLHRVDALLDWLLPDVAAAVERIDRAQRRGQLTDPMARRRSRAALAATAQVLAASGQREAGQAVARLADAIPDEASTGTDPAGTAGPLADHLVDLAGRIAGGDTGASAVVGPAIARFSATGSAPGPGRPARPGEGPSRLIGHDLAASAAVVHLARALVVADGPDGLAILPAFPLAWYGAAIEVHDLPTAWGRLSYAVRWHGSRPAVLWDLEPHPGVGPVTITAPSLDPTWTTTEPRGDALLGEVAPPEGVDLLREVAEHPDIDPAMRRPGREPDASGPSLPEGGSFS